MNNERKKELRKQAKQLTPVITIGKQGFTENVAMQIKNYVRAHHLCKVKFSSEIPKMMHLTKKAFATLVSEQTNTEIIEQIGFVLVLWKR